MHRTLSTSLARAAAVAALVAGVLAVPLAGSAAAAPCSDDGPVTIGPAVDPGRFMAALTTGRNVRVRRSPNTSACTHSYIQPSDRVRVACSTRGDVPRGRQSDRWYFVRHYQPDLDDYLTTGWTYGTYVLPQVRVPQCPPGL